MCDESLSNKYFASEKKSRSKKKRELEWKAGNHNDRIIYFGVKVESSLTQHMIRQNYSNLRNFCAQLQLCQLHYRIIHVYRSLSLAKKLALALVLTGDHAHLRIRSDIESPNTMDSGIWPYDTAGCYINI